MKITISVITIAFMLLLPGISLSNANLIQNFDFSQIESQDIDEENPKYWIEHLRLDQADSNEHIYGISVSIYGDYAVIPRDDSVDIHKKVNGSWNHHANIVIEDDLEWGVSSVDINERFIMLGCIKTLKFNETHLKLHGAVFFFEKIGSAWQQVTKFILKESGILEYNNFWWWMSIHPFCSVSLSNNFGIYGFIWDDTLGNYSGSAHIFSFNGNTWTYETKIMHRDIEEEDFFGFSVAVSDSHAFISAIGDDNFTSTNVGVVYCYRKNGVKWKFMQKLRSNEIVNNFGYSMALDNNILVVGSICLDSGFAQVFKYNEPHWLYQNKICSDCKRHDRFGQSISLDENQVIIGTNSGTFYYFVKNETSWLQQQQIKLPADWGPSSVAIDDDSLLVGIHGLDLAIFYKRNYPPKTPWINGSSWGELNKDLFYHISSIDPENHQVQYQIDWGDGNVETTDFMNSGKVHIISHQWHQPGHYLITLRSMDIHGLKCEKLTTFPIRIEGAILNIDNLSVADRKMHVEISNSGNIQTEGVTFSASIQGGFFGFIDYPYENKSIKLIPNECKTISFHHNCFGFGTISIMVFCSAENANMTTYSTDAFILGSFIVIKD